MFHMKHFPYSVFLLYVRFSNVRRPHFGIDINTKIFCQKYLTSVVKDVIIYIVKGDVQEKPTRENLSIFPTSEEADDRGLADIKAKGIVNLHWEGEALELLLIK